MIILNYFYRLWKIIQYFKTSPNKYKQISFNIFMKDMKNYHFTIDEMREALINIKKQINKTEWFPEQILSVNRGGCVPGVYLSHAINVPHKVLDVQLRYDNNNPN